MSDDVSERRRVRVTRVRLGGARVTHRLAIPHGTWQSTEHCHRHCRVRAARTAWCSVMSSVAQYTSTEPHPRASRVESHVKLARLSGPIPPWAGPSRDLARDGVLVWAGLGRSYHVTLCSMLCYGYMVRSVLATYVQYSSRALERAPHTAQSTAAAACGAPAGTASAPRS